MKYTIIPHLFTSLFAFLAVVFFFSLNAYCAETVLLSHNQYMVTHTGASIGDIVGTFDPWFPTDDCSLDNFAYSLTDNEKGIYAINSSTGIISIKENTGLVAGWDTLVVQTQLLNITQNYFVYVRVKSLSECYFIDPTSTESGNGTKESPFSSWTQVEFNIGKAYFQRRGTVSSKSLLVNKNGASGNEIIIGSYGSGKRPRITVDTNSEGIIVAGDFIQIFEFEISGNKYGIRTSSGAETPTQHCLFSDIILHSNCKNGQIYFVKHGDVGNNKFYHRLYDIVAYNGLTYGLKFEGSNIVSENVRTYGNVSGISIPIWGDNNTIRGLSAYSNKGYGLELSGCSHDVSYSYFNNNYINLVVDDPGSAGSIIHHNLFEGSTGDASIKLRGNGIFWKSLKNLSSGRNITIEYNTIRNNTKNSGISIEYSMKKTSIFRNYIYNNQYGIYIGKNAEKVDTVLIHYNVMYGNLRYDIYGYQGSAIQVYNNTVDGSIYFFATTNNVARNNFYKTLTGTYTASNNIRIGAIPVENYFINYIGHDYRLKPQALLAIDEGYHLSLSPDIQLISVPQGEGPDIGAYEYIPVAVEEVPAAPSTLTTVAFTDNSITLNWKDNSTNENGFYIKRTLATNAKETQLIEVPVNASSFTDKELSPGTTYIYTIQAVNQAGASEKSNPNIASTLSTAENKRVKDGLIAYYNFNYDPYNLIRDLSGYADQVNLKILNPSSTSWNVTSKLSVNSSTALVSTVTAKKVIEAIKGSNALTFEMWITPFEPFTTSSSRILSIGSSNNDECIAIEQYYDTFGNKSLNYGVRLRTATTNNTGFPELISENYNAYLTMQHIVYVKDSVGNEALYLNGRMMAQGYRPGNLIDWSNNFYIRLVNEADLNNPWNGALYLTAIYNRSLSEKEIAINYDLGPSDSIRNNGMPYHINIYPNPASDLATIEITPDKNMNYIPATYFCIKDMMGRTYLTERVFNPNTAIIKEINVKDFAAGVYFVQMISYKEQSTVKLIVK